MYYLKDDILAFVAKIKDGAGGVYWLSGIDPALYGSPEFFDALFKEISRTTRSGDLLILDYPSPDFDSQKFGFEGIMELGPSRMTTKVFQKKEMVEKSS